MERAGPHVRNWRSCSSCRRQPGSHSLLRAGRRPSARTTDSRRVQVLLRRNRRATAVRTKRDQARLHVEGARRLLESPRQWSSAVPCSACRRSALVEGDGRTSGPVAGGARRNVRNARSLGRAARQDTRRCASASVDDGARGSARGSATIGRPAFALNILAGCVGRCSTQASGAVRLASSTAFRIRRRSAFLAISSADVLPTAAASFFLFGVVTTNGCTFSDRSARIASNRSQLLA
jgi:hypothetical protein